MIINHELSENEMKQLHSEFHLLDLDKDGEISFMELLNAMHKQGIQITENQLFNTFKLLHTSETNQDSTLSQVIRNPSKWNINYSEFIAAAINLKKYLNQERLWSIFMHFDTD